MNFLRNAPIGVKLALAPAFSLICLLAVAATAWWGSQALVGQIRNVGEVSMPRLAAVQDLGSRLSHLQRQLMQTLSWEAIGQKAERIAELDKQILQQLSEFDTQVSQFSQLPDLEASQRSAIEALQKHYKVYSHTAKETLDIKSAGVATAASFVFTLDSAYSEATKQIDVLASHEKEAVSSSVADARAQADRSGIVLLITSAAALLSAGALAWLVQRQILPPLQRAAAMARTVAGGDLSQASQVDSTDATGQVLSAMNDMRLQLVQLIGRVRQSADSIATASAEIAGGNADLSHRTEQQAAALEETAASMQEMTESLHRNAETARQANQLASSALTVADRGGQVVGQVVQTMQDITSSSHRISDIIGVIDGIAFQTNILALNAAVEAARAGEQGRGFAVVAAEVRSLAQRSAAAAREIKVLISDSVSKVEVGSRLVGDAGSTMTDIVDQVRKVTDLIAEIDSATNEQSSGVSQVNQAVSSLDQGTQQNAALVEQSAAAAESLKNQADELMGLVAVFKTGR